MSDHASIRFDIESIMRQSMNPPHKSFYSALCEAAELNKWLVSGDRLPAAYVPLGARTVYIRRTRPAKPSDT